MKTLAVAAGIVFWTLVLGTAFLAFFPGSDAGEPAVCAESFPDIVCAEQTHELSKTVMAKGLAGMGQRPSGARP